MVVYVLWVHLELRGPSRLGMPLDHYPSREECVDAGRDWARRATAYAKRAPAAVDTSVVRSGWTWLCADESIGEARADLKRWGIADTTLGVRNP